jgi:hypothetical protein
LERVGAWKCLGDRERPPRSVYKWRVGGGWTGAGEAAWRRDRVWCRRVGAFPSQGWRWMDSDPTVCVWLVSPTGDRVGAAVRPC